MARTISAIHNSLDVRPLYLHGVQGLLPCANDIIFKPALPRLISDPSYQQKTLVFFGGDIQNFIHSMDRSDPKINCEMWCLESAVEMLGSYFPSHHIVVIRPARTAFDHVNCYDNFVVNNCLGSPKHKYNYTGLVHLERLLFKISSRIRNTASDKLFQLLLGIRDDDDNIDEDPLANITWQYVNMPRRRKELLIRWQKSLRLHKYPLTLVAFNKGCVVLNQFLYEFHFAKGMEPKAQDSSFIDRIEHMYYLDASHAGRSDVYLTSRGLLRTVQELGIELHVHLSQFQMDDQVRPYIQKQCNEFIELLRSFNAKLVVHRHVCKFNDLRAQLNVFQSFMRLEKRASRFPSLPAAPLPPPPRQPPRPQTPPSRPHYTPNPRERAITLEDAIGVSLIKSNNCAYPALQMILRRSVDDIMESYSRNEELSETEPGSEQSSASEDTDSSAASSSPPNSPVLFSDASGSNSPTIFIPSVPSSPDAFEPDVASAENPGPSTSSAPGPSNLSHPFDPDRPSTSGAKKRPPMENDFTVLLKHRSDRINFETDLEAKAAYESAKYYKIDAPVVATFTEGRTHSKVHIYTPVNEHYTPLILNTRTRLNNIDSSTAATPARARPVETPGPSHSAVARSSQSNTPRGALNTTRRTPANVAQATSNSQPRAETNASRRRLVRINQSVPTSSSSELDTSSSSDSTSSDSEPLMPARSTRNYRSRRGSHRYNLRSTR